MGSKVIQVSIEDELLAALDARSQKEGRSRAEIIREACRSFLQKQERPPEKPRGALAFVGAWGDLVSDEEIDKFIAGVYASRERDTGRPVDLEP